MMTTTLLFTLASLGGVPSSAVASTSAVLLERRTSAAGLYVPTGVAVPVQGRDDALRSVDLFGRRASNGGVSAARTPDDAIAQAVTLLRPRVRPVCRF